MTPYEVFAPLVFAASALAAGVSARANALVERELAARALIGVDAYGSVCPAVPTTVIVLQPGINGTATTTITTTTTVFPGQSTTASVTGFGPPDSRLLIGPGGPSPDPDSVVAPVGLASPRAQHKLCVASFDFPTTTSLCDGFFEDGE